MTILVFLLGIAIGAFGALTYKRLLGLSATAIADVTEKKS
jgi:hypothetical protein